MKSLFLFIVASVCVAYVHAAPMVAEAPIKDYGTPVTVAISSFTLTKLPTSQTSGRIGVILGVPSSNTGDITGFFGNCTSTSLANTIRPFKWAKASNSSFVSMREDVCLWLITTHTAAENVHYQEVMQ